jgi:hypothetical protein
MGPWPVLETRGMIRGNNVLIRKSSDIDMKILDFILNSLNS